MPELTKEQPFTLKISEAQTAVTLNENLFKGNIPDSKKSARNGNGEGCWWAFESTSDKKIYDDDVNNTTFMAILCNDSVYYPLSYGSVLQLKVIPNCRPVVDMDWFKNQLAYVGIEFELEE
jgi:hypothetical protein